MKIIYTTLKLRNTRIRTCLDIKREAPTNAVNLCQIKLLRKYYDADCDVIMGIQHQIEAERAESK